MVKMVSEAVARILSEGERGRRPSWDWNPCVLLDFNISNHNKDKFILPFLQNEVSENVLCQFVIPFSRYCCNLRFVLKQLVLWITKQLSRFEPKSSFMINLSIILYFKKIHFVLTSKRFWECQLSWPQKISRKKNYTLLLLVYRLFNFINTFKYRNL